MRELRILIPIVALLVLIAGCQSATAGEGGGPAVDKPPVGAVFAAGDDFELRYMPGVPVSDREWDVELEYDVRDLQGIFDHFDAQLVAAGFQRFDLEEDSDEIEADYHRASDGLRVDLEVELDGGWTEVDLDIDAPGPPASGEEWFDLSSFAGLVLDFDYPGASIVDVEWDFDFEHPASAVSASEAFDYYDGLLAGMDWSRYDLEIDGEEYEADYVRDGVRLELEVERDDGMIEVELELNKARFY